MPGQQPSVSAILDYLGVEHALPSVRLLHELVTAYVRRVPWETAFRIARRAAATELDSCPRWPSTFWSDALFRGGGGTCFESNYAFFSLLQTLGFQGYLTINDMGETRGCHSAIVIELDEHQVQRAGAGDGANADRWLVDVGLPLFVPVPLRNGQSSQRASDFHTYRLTPQRPGVYEVARDRHPAPYAFTFLDRPVDDATYREITTLDYGRNGLFLDAVIIHRIIGGRIWRFNGRADPPLLESFPADPAEEKSEQVMAGNTVSLLADLFTMDAGVLRSAFAAGDS